MIEDPLKVDIQLIRAKGIFFSRVFHVAQRRARQHLAEATKQSQTALLTELKVKNLGTSVFKREVGENSAKEQQRQLKELRRTRESRAEAMEGEGGGGRMNGKMPGVVVLS